MERSPPQRREPLPVEIATEWLAPFLDYLAKERRYSRYTVRNYRQAFEDFWRWRAGAGLAERGFDRLSGREMRDFIIEGQRRFGRRTLHNHVSGLRAFCRFWQRRGRVVRGVRFFPHPLPVRSPPLAGVLGRAGP